MEKDKRWHGCDGNNAVCLFEYGLFVRYVSKDKKWKCLYKNSVCPNMFSVGWTSEVILEETLTTGWAKDEKTQFLRFCDSTWEEWIALNMSSRISDFVAYFGELNLFGEDYWGGYTVKEMCRRLHIKYDKDYENA